MAPVKSVLPAKKQDRLAPVESIAELASLPLAVITKFLLTMNALTVVLTSNHHQIEANVNPYRPLNADPIRRSQAMVAKIAQSIKRDMVTTEASAAKTFAEPITN